MAYSIDLQFDSKTQFDIEFSLDFETVTDFDIEFGFDAVYTGEYEIDPTIDGYILETANKKMLKDLTVNSIALSEVDNAQGGKTVTIAGI